MRCKNSIAPGQGRVRPRISDLPFHEWPPRAAAAIFSGGHMSMGGDPAAHGLSAQAASRPGSAAAGAAFSSICFAASTLRQASSEPTPPLSP